MWQLSKNAKNGKHAGRHLQTFEGERMYFSSIDFVKSIMFQQQSQERGFFFENSFLVRHGAQFYRTLCSSCCS